LKINNKIYFCKADIPKL